MMQSPQATAEYAQREASRQVGFEVNIENIRVCDVRPGDTVFHDGKVMTVCRADISKDPSMGWMLFGDSYVLGRRPVPRLAMPRN